MPYNFAPVAVAPGTVLPQSLSTSFVMSFSYPLITVSYNDGTFERSLIQDYVTAPRALRTWILTKRLTTTQLTALLNFWETQTLGGLNPFYFYDPFGVNPGDRIGSNFDPTGDNTVGRVKCFFRGDWSQRTELGGAGGVPPQQEGRHTVGTLTLVEAADLVLGVA
jgi:hypothetical protein